MIDTPKDPVRAPRWMSGWLIAAGIYNILWGSTVVLFPGLYFRLVGMPEPFYPMIWQCVGMIVGVFGVGYLAASLSPLRHWPITLVGLLGKIFGPIGFLFAIAQGDLPWAFGWTLLTNDLIWWIPFAMILHRSYRTLGGRYEDESTAPPVGEALDRARTHDGRTLGEVTGEGPALILFLRHAGCIFCSETAARIGEQIESGDDRRTPLVVVHMSDDEEIRRMLEMHGLEGAIRVSDPNCELYAAFEVARGNFWQLFGLKVFLSGIRAFLKGHRTGMLRGDGLRLPGLFLVEGDRILHAQRPEHAGGELDAERALCELPA